MQLGSDQDGIGVTVLVMTYNHAPYIREAINGALRQRLTVPLEILISEDCSTDGTRQIVEGYARENPNQIRLMLSEFNLHTNEVVARGLCAARGRYLAMLDGDDFWTTDDKLQTQFNFLESHPEFSICFHNVRVVDDRSQSSGRRWNRDDQPEESGLADILQGNDLATSSVMYRRRAIDEIPQWYDDFFPVTDWPLHVLYAERGRIGYLQREMGAYRIHAAGCFSNQSEFDKLKSNIDFYRKMRRGLRGRLDRPLRRGQFQYFWGWAEEYRRRADRERVWQCLRWAWEAQPYRHPRWLTRMIATLIKASWSGRGGPGAPSTAPVEHETPS